MDSFNKLLEIFRDFPGIGPRQAKRFVYFLLTSEKRISDELIKAVSSLKKETAQCRRCFRYFRRIEEKSICRICADETRSKNELLLVATDTELDAIEKSRVYNGLYFVIGGTIHLLEKKNKEKLRLKELEALVKKCAEKGELKEIIFALSANPDGEHTADTIKSFLKETIMKYSLKVTALGRGLSTGSEVEYADSDTIKNALQHRL